VIFPLELSRAVELLEASALEVAGHLAPGVLLLGGESQALRSFVEALPGVTARYLGVKLPIHSSHFRSVGEAFRAALRGAPLRVPRLAYLPNASGEVLDAPSPEQMIDLLARQVYQPMLWRESLDAALRRRPGATLVEVGPGRTLGKLLAASASWHPEVSVLNADELLWPKAPAARQ
jgi:acyl transferase domain-containing protein